VYPARRRASLPAKGCPAFGEDTLVDRPSNAKGSRKSSVRPGLHRPIAGEHGVVWWDPTVLALEAEEDGGLRQSTILMADNNGMVANDGIARYATWRKARSAAVARASAPSRVVRVVTEAKDGDSLAASRVLFEATNASRRRRAHGKRFGIVVHGVLATVALDADEAVIADATTIQGRLVSATDNEMAAAINAVSEALAHPLLARARAAARVLRETSVMLVEADGSIVEGVVDLAFHETGSGFTVVDFKTDVQIVAKKEVYARQVDAYARAIATATGQSAHGIILSV
jgi:hypothetical protein